MVIDDKLRDKEALEGCFIYHTFQRNGIDRKGKEVKYCTLYAGLNQHHSVDCGYAGEPVEVQIGEWHNLIPYRRCNFEKYSMLALINE